MRSLIPFAFLPLWILTCATPALAQRTLADLQRAFVAESRKLGAERPTREQRDTLLDRQIKALAAFLDKEAKGDDRWNGRLMLADLSLALGRREAAAKALKSIDIERAPALLLVSAGAMARHLQLDELKSKCIAAALEKPAPVKDRMAMARLLMIVLHEIEHGERVLAESLAAAKGDEEKAFVRWHRADVLRDREDLPENTGFDELQKLADDLPNTYWGSVAKDRLRATRLSRGDEAIDFKARTITGERVVLSELRGRVVLLSFWSLGDYDLDSLVQTFTNLRRTHGEKLAIVSVCLDREPEVIKESVQKLGLDWPVIGDGKGIENDVALRWFVEGPTLHVIDRTGKVRALGLHVGTKDARSMLDETVRKLTKTK
ncbi:MAG: TlpA family protein disulfide reductase [bacterium]|nr:TlpA family protein disulfide reductase [bacterium]